MATPTLIYCADGNRRFAEIAIAAGFEYGAKLPSTIYHQPYFVDQDWKKPNREKYMSAVKKYRPYMASVIDWEYHNQFDEVLSWANEISKYVEIIMVIPKVHGGIADLPRQINGKEIRLGYSVPTKYGGTQVFISEFTRWPVHLLGGSPIKQYRLAKYVDVKSVDGNSHQKAAQKGWYFNGKKWTKGADFGNDFIYRLFEKSCKNIKRMWQCPECE